MLRRLLGRVVLLTVSCGASLAMAHSQATYSHQQQRLQHIGQSISSLREHLSSDKDKKGQAEQRLQTVETSIGQMAKNYKSTLSKLAREEHELTRVETKHQQYQRNLALERTALAKQVRAEYMLGRQQYLKILLNQEDPARIDRYLTYYHYLMHARMQLIQQIKTTLKKVEQSAVEVRQQTEQLENTKAKQQRASQKLEHERWERRHILNQLNASIGSQQAQLEKLLHDKAQLQHVIKYLQAHRYYYTAGKEFSSTRGKLPWPIRHGKVVRKFGAPLVHGRLHSNGILIAAPLGTTIHAIYPGKVVFAHWLRGYGLVVIVQHSHVYMTLYAHLESIYARVGEDVQPGTVLATVGNSGGLQDAALYFEITRFGHGINPLDWLRTK